MCTGPLWATSSTVVVQAAGTAAICHSTKKCDDGAWSGLGRAGITSVSVQVAGLIVKWGVASAGCVHLYGYVFAGAGLAAEVHHTLCSTTIIP